MNNNPTYHWKTTRVNKHGTLQEINIRSRKMSSPLEYDDMLYNVRLSKEFQMLSRGFVEFYGKDLIDYKRELPLNQNRNNFLILLTKYLQDELEDNCPTSWQQFNLDYWKAFIYAFFPKHIKMTRKRKFVRTFICQLEKFVHWLHNRKTLSCYQDLLHIIQTITPKLEACEHLTNDQFLKDYPNHFAPNSDPRKGLEKIAETIQQYPYSLTSLFRITSIAGDIVVLTDTETAYTYSVTGLLLDSTLLNFLLWGNIGKMNSQEFIWDVVLVTNFFPEEGEGFIKFKAGHYDPIISF